MFLRIATKITSDFCQTSTEPGLTENSRFRSPGIREESLHGGQIPCRTLCQIAALQAQRFQIIVVLGDHPCIPESKLANQRCYGIYTP